MLSFARPCVLSVSALLAWALAGSGPEALGAFVTGKLNSSMGAGSCQQSLRDSDAERHQVVILSALHLLPANWTANGGEHGSQGTTGTSSAPSGQGAGVSAIIETNVPPPLNQTGVFHLSAERVPPDLLITSIFEPPRA